MTETTLINIELPILVETIGNPDQPGVAEKEIDEIYETAKNLHDCGVAATTAAIAEKIILAHPWRFNEWFYRYGYVKSGTITLPLKDKAKLEELTNKIARAVAMRDSKAYFANVKAMNEAFAAELKA